MSELKNLEETDDEKTKKAFILLTKFMVNQKIEPYISISTCALFFATSYLHSGLSYSQYKDEMLKMSEFYEHLWDGKEIT
jgi:hypothetical protein